MTELFGLKVHSWDLTVYSLKAQHLDLEEFRLLCSGLMI